MSIKVSQKFGNSVLRLVAIALLGSTVAGCSSDAMRFSGGYFGTDNLTTSSVRPVTNTPGAPVPSANVGMAPAQDYSTANQALNQPYPARPANSNYDPMSTGTVASGARMSATPMSVQQQSLPPVSSQSASLEQPMPARAPAQTTLSHATLPADPIKTATTRPADNGMGGQKVVLKPGDTIAALSRRYNVSMSAIMQANGLTSGAVQAGQTLIIPSYSVSPNSAKASATAEDFSKGGRLPEQPKKTEQKVALLPKPVDSRDKSASVEPKKMPAGGDGGTYKVVAGDTLTKIARQTGSNIDELKRLNGLDTASIRIGQVLKLPNGSTSTPDPVKTSAVKTSAVASTGKPAAQAQPKATETASNNDPKPYVAPAATKSVTEVASKDPSVSAPASTGISKYRWPVRGQVIAAYGANVNGSRNDGIDISVPEGTPVKAAENGVVIYASNGLKELGNTVLLRHDDGTVTVYGHAGNLNVARGQKVTRGQVIASSGMSGNASRPMLHFEVRKDATPVNPISYLE
jgi:murein DD-endopeptidase MepM/ murein hydrolase activator NlpD